MAGRMCSCFRQAEARTGLALVGHGIRVESWPRCRHITEYRSQRISVHVGEVSMIVGQNACATCFRQAEVYSGLALVGHGMTVEPWPRYPHMGRR